MASLYDRVELYDLFDSDRKYKQTILHWQKVFGNAYVNSLLDVSIGTGSLTLPLAELNVELYGSDISRLMLKRCEQKAEEKNIQVNLKQCDFRSLNKNFQRTFDCVASTGNSLAHVPNEELLDVLVQMDALVSKGGYLYLDLRNWDKIMAEKKRFWTYNPVFNGEERINCTQLWDYNPDGSMDFNILYAFEKDSAIVHTEVFTEHYYPITREMILGKLSSLGYSDIRTMCMPAFAEWDVDTVDWYCIFAKK